MAKKKINMREIVAQIRKHPAEKIGRSVGIANKSGDTIDNRGFIAVRSILRGYSYVVAVSFTGRGTKVVGIRAGCRFWRTFKEAFAHYEGKGSDQKNSRWRDFSKKRGRTFKNPQLDEEYGHHRGAAYTSRDARTEAREILKRLKRASIRKATTDRRASGCARLISVSPFGECNEETCCCCFVGLDALGFGRDGETDFLSVPAQADPDL